VLDFLPAGANTPPLQMMARRSAAP
jgi:hypothetical protein